MLWMLSSALSARVCKGYSAGFWCFHFCHQGHRTVWRAKSCIVDSICLGGETAVMRRPYTACPPGFTVTDQPRRSYSASARFAGATETPGEGRVSLSGLTIQLAFANLTEMKAARQPFYVSSDDAPAKQKIVIAALDLFVRDGLCETSVRDIARASGFSNPALFKHFSSKEALAHYLFERCYLELFNLITRAILSGDTFATKQRAVIGAYMTALERDRNAVLYVQDNLRQFWPKMPITLRKHSIVGEVRTLLELGRKEGTVTATVDVGLLTVAWIGTLQQFARAQYFGEFKLPSRVIATTLEDLLTRMVKA